MPPKVTATSMKRVKGKQPVKPGPSKKARREPAPPVHSRHTRTTAARQASNHASHTNRSEDTESSLSSVPEATPGPVPEEASEKEAETEEEEEEEKEAEEEEEEEGEEAPIVPVAIRPAQVRTGGRGQSSLCWKYYTRVVVGSRRTKKGNEVDKVEARCKLCTME
jgi:hypothetical protein